MQVTIAQVGGNHSISESDWTIAPYSGGNWVLSSGTASGNVGANASTTYSATGTLSGTVDNGTYQSQIHQSGNQVGAMNAILTGNIVDGAWQTTGAATISASGFGSLSTSGTGVFHVPGIEAADIAGNVNGSSDATSSYHFAAIEHLAPDGTWSIAS